MKRLLAALLALVMLLAVLTACMASENSSEAESKQPEITRCLTEENGVYKLTLPKSKKVIELDEDEVRFVPYIVDDLVEAAENKISDDVSQYDHLSGFYLKIANDYLCLGMEVIKYIDPTASTEEGDYLSDHEHLFFSERITSRAVADYTAHIGTDYKDYEKIQFFPQPTLEFTEDGTYDATKFEWAKLTDDDMKLLRQIYNGGKGWNDDNVVDRVPFYFDGRIRFATADSCGWMYFGIDQNVLYYNNMFTQIDSEVLEIIERSQNTINSGDNTLKGNDYLVSHIQIESGNTTIHPFGYLLRSQIDYEYGNVSETHAHRLDLPDFINRNADTIPILVLKEKVSYSVQANGCVDNVFLYTPSGDEYTESETTVDALSNLAEGTYFVAFEVLLGESCGPDAPRISYCYEDVFCLVVGEQNTTKQDSKQDSVLIESLKFSQYLNDINFVPGVSQGSFKDQVEGYAYNNTAVADIIVGENYDGLYGGGWHANGGLFGFHNDYVVTDDEKYANYSNILYSHVQLEGLPLPYDIQFGDSLGNVFKAVGIGLNPYEDFTPDQNSDTDITLYSKNTESLVFQNLKLTKEPIDYDLPFVLTYTETYNAQQVDGKPTVVQRVVKLSFDNDANLSFVEISVNEKITRQTN